MSLAVSGLTVRLVRHGTPVLEDVSFSVPDGAVLGVVGAGGSGKSMLLAAIAGLVRPSAGRIEVGGSEGERPGTDARRRTQAIGYVPDSRGVEDELTPTEHLAFHASLRGIGRDKRAGLIAGLLELVDLGDWRDESARTLTDGLRRRLSIARALIHDPALLLLDDPAAGLDPGARADLVELVGGLAEAGRTVVLAGGDLDDFAGCLTDLAVLSRGRLVAFGPTDAVLGTTDGTRQVRVRLADGSEQYYDVAGADEQRRLLARLVADGVAVDEIAAIDTGISARLLAAGHG